MDGEFAVVRNGLNDENPSVSAPKAPTDRAGKANVITRVDVVLRQQRGPARINPHDIAPDHRCVEVGFEQTRAGAPDVKITIAPRLEQKEYADKKTDEHNWEGGGMRST